MLGHWDAKRQATEGNSLVPFTTEGHDRLLGLASRGLRAWRRDGTERWRASVLSLHAAYIAWLIFGAFFTRCRPRLAALHVATLVYGVIIEIFGFWCPLTAFETWLEARGGVSAYRGPFLLITSMRWCTLIFPRTFSLRALSPSAF